jgi:hypothetical protein
MKTYTGTFHGTFVPETKKKTGCGCLSVIAIFVLGLLMFQYWTSVPDYVPTEIMGTWKGDMCEGFHKCPVKFDFKNYDVKTGKLTGTVAVEGRTSELDGNVHVIDGGYHIRVKERINGGPDSDEYQYKMQFDMKYNSTSKTITSDWSSAMLSSEEYFKLSK